MRDAFGEREVERLAEALGEGARDVLRDAEPGSAAAVAEALEQLALALGEDEWEGEPDPGLPADYEVLGVLGRGAGGVVYLARQASLGREVAVKVLHGRSGARDVERLLAEGRRLAALAHPGIVVVHEVGRSRSGVYVTLEREVGGSLQDLLARGPLNAALVARLARQCAKALAYMHSRGVVHLDLKPSNVLLDARGDAKVADFGLARELATEPAGAGPATTAGLIGTPAFMAPEQAADRRGEIGERTDVYGLGATMYACLAGGPPFAGASLAAVLDAVRFEEPRALRSASPDTPPDLAAIVASAMAKAPSERYASATAMAADLARFAAGEPVTARPPGPLRRLARRMRRHRRDALVAGAAAALALASVWPFAAGGDAGDAGEAGAQRGSEVRSADERASWRRAASELAAAGEHAAARHLLARAGELDAPAGDVESGGRETGRGGALGAVDVDARAQGFGGTGEPGDGDAAAPSRGDAPAQDPGDAPAQDVGDSSTQGRDGSRPAAAAQGGAAVRIAVAAFLVLDDGTDERLWSDAATGAIGERVRLAGHGRATSEDLPLRESGVDFLHVQPPSLGPARAGTLSAEIEGVLAERDGRVAWLVTDRELDLHLRPIDGSYFVALASDGVLAGGARLLEARRYLFGGGGATVFVLGEVARTEDADAGAELRDLAAWRAALRETLAREAAAPRSPEEWLAEATPDERAAVIDGVIALALLGDDSLTAPLDAFDPAAAHAMLTDGPFEARGTFAKVTVAGGDLDHWLAEARRSAKRPRLDPAAALAGVPEPSSARARARALPEWKEWIWVLYELAAVVLAGTALASPRGSARRRAAFGWAVTAALLSLDKWTLPALGGVPFDPLAAGIASLSLLGLAPWAGTSARVAAAVFAGAALHQLGVVLLGWSDVRLPLALGFACLANVAASLSGSAALARMRWVAWAGYLPLAAFALAGVGPEPVRIIAFALTLLWMLLSAMAVAVAASRCGPARD